MHEAGIVSSLVKMIERTIKSEGLSEVEKVVLEVGELSGLVPRYLEKCWPAAVDQTFMEKTRLELIVIPGIVKCQICSDLYNAVEHDLHCPICGSDHMEMLSGNDLIVQEILCR